MWVDEETGMAFPDTLTKCTDCGGIISKKSHQCVHCGAEHMSNLVARRVVDVIAIAAGIVLGVFLCSKVFKITLTPILK